MGKEFFMLMTSKIFYKMYRVLYVMLLKETLDSSA